MQIRPHGEKRASINTLIWCAYLKWDSMLFMICMRPHILYTRRLHYVVRTYAYCLMFMTDIHFSQNKKKRVKSRWLINKWKRLWRNRFENSKWMRLLFHLCGKHYSLVFVIISFLFSLWHHGTSYLHMRWDRLHRMGVILYVFFI